MRAVGCTAGRLSVVERPEPRPGTGQVLIDVLRCGICGSDLHAREHCDELAEVALLMASLPPHVNLLEATVLPVEQLYVGRG